MSEILTTAQVLRHVADNLDAGREDGYGLQMHGCSGWINLLCPLAAIRNGHKLRLKPRTRMMNGFEVPAPLDHEPESRLRYWTIEATSKDGVIDVPWFADADDQRVLSQGLMFATKEDAIANFKAICGEDPNEE
ncbi:MAG: hypothetical protein Tp138OMZ00d2C19078241_36 [Prokaryotic dsDNA virus sp.]|jgi:hypothetical protein|nr:MAG: hypothetical protein Tp138OMZ00d2C19078241_36 [Prokaryotic dsDNA virus sp.]|tara:strand:- start:41555 stop:41956 length:402 start_codon:yes stop_codon:yes gene_type:complete